MDYKIISSDDHLDLGYLPTDFWTKQMAASLGDRRPHVEERESGPVWVCDGKVWGGWRGKVKGEAGAKRALGGTTVTAFDRAASPTIRNGGRRMQSSASPTWIVTASTPM